MIGAFGAALWTTVRLFAQPGDAAGLRLSQAMLTWPAFAGGDQMPLNWIDAGGFVVPIKLLVDPLSCVMMLVVTGVGSLIHVYSVGYMAHDEGKVRFFSYLNLFTFFMLLLVLGGNLPLLFVGWEGVGLCSYLLIGFWYRKDSASAAGLKAFVVNRVGDVGLILGMIFLFHALGTLDLVELANGARALPREALWQWGPATIAALLLFVGATGKSAQIPLHVWLPDAMEGPTPVSALIHAATMVTAGVYMVSRLGPLYAASETALLVVAVVGTATALMAGTIAVVQDDIKRVLAYSTVSQLGFMFLAAGRRRLRYRRLPPLHPRLLQGAAVPRLGLGDPRHVGRAGHEEDGRAARRGSPGRSGPSSSARWRSRASRCSPASTARTRSWPPHSARGTRSCSAWRSSRRC